MKRIIKFRAYETKEKEMVHDIHIAPEYGWLVLADNDAMSERGRSENWVLMQFTGLLDKNGKEVFEGDIVDNGYGIKEIVEFGCQNVDAFEGVGFNLWSFIGKHGAYDCARLQSEIEVVGNIYENPDLLNPKSK